MAKKQLMCLWGALAPVYKGGEGRRPALGAGQVGGNRLGLLVLVAPFLLSEGERGKKREREKERGATPPPLVQF